LIILVRVRDIPGRCRIPGYEVGWFEVDDVKYGVDNKRPSDDKKEEEQGRAAFRKLEISKSLDNATPDLMFRAMQGVVIPSVEIQMVETAKGGVANFPFLMLRFEQVFLSNWELNLQIEKVVEELEFDYMKVAIQYHSTKDGINYKREATRGWDLTVYDSKKQGVSWEYPFKLRGDRPMGPRND
jgi:type VI protein secretion system component Hcp